MPDLTEEEYDALDEYYTKNPLKVSGDEKSGFFMQHKGNIIIVSDTTATYLRVNARPLSRGSYETGSLATFPGATPSWHKILPLPAHGCRLRC
jgi:hypothetical protein